MPLADIPAHRQNMQMRLFQSVWFTLLLAVAVTLPATWGLSNGTLPRATGLPLALGGTLLLFDWGFGLRMLPRLLSPAQIGDESRRAECILYSFPLALPRLAAVTLFIVLAALGVRIFGDGDWLGWAFIAALIGYAVAMVMQSFKAIDLAVQEVLNLH